MTDYSTRVIIKNRHLPQGEQSNGLGWPVLKLIGFVYVYHREIGDTLEFKVFAPCHASGPALDWLDMAIVHSPDREEALSEVKVNGPFRDLAINLIRRELEKSSEPLPTLPPLESLAPDEKVIEDSQEERNLINSNLVLADRMYLVTKRMNSATWVLAFAAILTLIIEGLKFYLDRWPIPKL